MAAIIAPILDTYAESFSAKKTEKKKQHRGKTDKTLNSKFGQVGQVAALDFSPDGNLILAMAGGEDQSLSIWDWRRGQRLATAKAEHLHLSANSARFNPWLFLQGKGAEEVGHPPGAACYTLVTCGESHVRFWTLTREVCPRAGGDGGRNREMAAGSHGGSDEPNQRKKRGGGGGGGGGKGGTGWEWSLTSRPGNFGVRGEIASMTCMSFIGEPRAGREEWQRRRRAMHDAPSPLPLPMARVITGAENGQVGRVPSGGEASRTRRLEQNSVGIKKGRVATCSIHITEGVH